MVIAGRLRGPARRAWLVGRALAAATLVWAVASRLADRPLLLPGPLDVATSWVALLASGRLLDETWVSLRRLAVAYAAAALVGVALGMAMGRWRAVDRVASPLVNSVRAVSGIAWIPIAVVWFGVSEWLPVFIIFYGAVFPFVLNAQAGIASVDARLVHVARSLGAGPRRIALRVILPATLPYLLTGARVGLGLAWMSIIAAELLGAPTGLGFSIQYARLLQQTPAMLAWILWVGAVGFALDAGMRAAVRRLAPWVSAGRLAAGPA
jgi:ABC-type nitrate/sulfonate/bicarbonate transport system permease component